MPVEKFLDNMSAKPLEARGHVGQVRPQKRVCRNGPAPRQEAPPKVRVDHGTAFHEAASESAFASFVKRPQKPGYRPGIMRHPGVHLDDYVVAVIERFAIPAKVGLGDAAIAGLINRDKPRIHARKPHA